VLVKIKYVGIRHLIKRTVITEVKKQEI